MEPTKEQLQSTAWWRENAPEGYGFYIIDLEPDEDCRQPSGFHRDVGYRYEDQDGFYWDKGAKHIEVWERPTTPPEIQWDGEGLPPVGCECEYDVGRHWLPAKVIGYDGPACVVAVDGEGYFGSTETIAFRPIRTERERMTEDLSKFLESQRFLRGGFSHSSRVVAKTLVAWLEERENQEEV